MKKRILSIFIPIMLVLVIGLGIILPTSLADKGEQSTINYDIEGRQIFAVDAEEEYVSQTGAATASTAYKGGAIFLEPGATLNFKGGEISGSSNTYGGAIYVCKGATLTMESGTITNCKASYGGAIYVESGATCTITGGTITGCKANYGSAIYVEKGANFSVSESAIIDSNDIEDENFAINVSEDTISAGSYFSGDDNNALAQFHYIELGNYPQSYVGDQLQSELEEQYDLHEAGGLDDLIFLDDISIERYEHQMDYVLNPFTWQMFEYHGEIYVRGESTPYDTSYNYQSTKSIPLTTGPKVVSGPAWFRVEPVKWLVLNYDQWKAGEETLEVISRDILTIMPFNYNEGNRFWSDASEIVDKDFGEPISGYGSLIYRYMKETLYSDLNFTSQQESIILETKVPNSIDTMDWDNYTTFAEYSKSPDELTEGENLYYTYDKLYLLSYYDVNVRYMGLEQISRLVAQPSDFALSNGAILVTQISVFGQMGYMWMANGLGSSAWWLRTTRSNLGIHNDFWGDTHDDEFLFSNFIFGGDGKIGTGWDHCDDIPMNYGVRPAMHLKIRP